MEVKAIANFDQFARLAEHIPGDLKRQYVFALNKIAARVQKEARDALDDDFILRNQYMQRSIVTSRAKPGSLSATVGTLNENLGLHLFGGRKVTDVASFGFRGADKKGKVKRGQGSGALLAAIESGSATGRRFFVMSKHGKKYIWAKTGTPQPRQRQRTGYSGPVLPRLPIEPMWLLTDKPITIKKGWNLEKVAEETLDQHGLQIMLDVIEDAWNHAVEKGRVWGL